MVTMNGGKVSGVQFEVSFRIFLNLGGFQSFWIGNSNVIESKNQYEVLESSEVIHLHSEVCLPLVSNCLLEKSQLALFRDDVVPLPKGIC